MWNTGEKRHKLVKKSHKRSQTNEKKTHKLTKNVIESDKLVKKMRSGEEK